MSRKYLKAQPPSCTFKTEADEDKIIWIDKDTPAGKMCEDDLRSLSSDNYTYDYVPEAELSAPADYGDSPAKLALAYFYDAARKREKPIGTYDTIALIIDTQYVRLTRYGRARVDYAGPGENNTASFTTGDEVVVAFEYQDVNRPVVVGFRYSPKDGREFYIRFKLNGRSANKGNYKIKVTYGAGESSEETEISPYGLNGPFTCFTQYAYAYLYYEVEYQADCYEPVFSYFYGDTQVQYLKYPTNLAAMTPVIEDGKRIYDIDFSGIKIIKEETITRQRQELTCGWDAPGTPAILYKHTVDALSIQWGRVFSGWCYFYPDDTYYSEYTYTYQEGHLTSGSLKIETDQYGANPTFTPSELSVDALYSAYIFNETTQEVVCDVEDVVITAILYCSYTMVTAPAGVITY